MKKILKNRLILGVAMLGVLASCDNYNEDDDDTLNTRADKPVVTLDATSFSVTEGETVSITMTADKALTVPMEFKLELLPSSTGTFREVEVSGAETDITTGAGVIGYIVTMPAYTTEYTLDITPILDLDVESTETFNFRLYGSSNSTGIIANGNESIAIEVANGTSDDFVAELDWNGTWADDFGTLHAGTYIGADGEEHEYCGFDFDMEILDNTFTPVYYDWDNCPAIATLPGSGPEEAPDGEYYIVAAFYTRTVAAAAVPQGGDLTYPVQLAMGKPGVFVHKADLSEFYSYAAGGYANGNDAAYKGVGILTKTGSNYVLTDFDDPSIILGEGRMANIRAFKRNK